MKQRPNGLLTREQLFKSMWETIDTLMRALRELGETPTAFRTRKELLDDISANVGVLSCLEGITPEMKAGSFVQIRNYEKEAMLARFEGFTFEKEARLRLIACEAIGRFKYTDVKDFMDISLSNMTESETISLTPQDLPKYVAYPQKGSLFDEMLKG